MVSLNLDFMDNILQDGAEQLSFLCWNDSLFHITRCLKHDDFQRHQPWCQLEQSEGTLAFTVYMLSVRFRQWPGCVVLFIKDKVASIFVNEPVW